MTDLVGLVGIGIGAFAATDIDDLFVLMLFFSQPKFTPSQVILGQYLGIGLLIALSALAAFIALIVPPFVIGMMGLLPLAIGIKKLLELIKKEDDYAPKSLDNINKRTTYLRFLTVAAVTFSNGGDNIGVYVPLFARSSTIGEVAILALVFLVITGVWCALGYYLVRHRPLAKRFSLIGRILLPFVLIGLGIFILVDAFLI